MKTASLLLSGLLCLFGVSATAQASVTDMMRDTSAQVAPKRHEVRSAHRAVHQDRRDIEAEHRNLERDRHVARREARDVRRIERRQDVLVARGDYRGAHALERERYHEMNEAKIARRQVYHDRNVIEIKRRELEHDRRVLENARRERD
ncbi:hypothetical protein LP420_23560 [Massilia sp. B-10]|nr:hypothetical protein LP420_23560 [Massilia sp. B-10]